MNRLFSFAFRSTWGPDLTAVGTYGLVALILLLAGSGLLTLSRR